MLRQIENRSWEVKPLDALWFFVVDSENRGKTEQWRRDPLVDSRAIGVLRGLTIYAT
ncbi:hypothetical protein QVN42_17590 [Yersinia nurmii]|uniref:Beta-glucuronidase n=1 Tax=Yersinia nurmii TaxID=685706 RepID=A0AAW7KAK0_9GAMM|nr:hypothetical protein [Yersinia nurmii]MDN0089165.1 hypothetical protein [Yersinia nurmii]CNF21354.1 Beta-glucuronidase [Yersinia nurmii]